MPTPAATPALTIVVPAYNEAARLASGAERLRRAGLDGAFDWSTTELCIVDDGSSDATAAVAAEVAATFPRASVHSLGANRGKGGAVRAGVALATGARICFLDADSSIDPHHVADLVAALDHADVAMGSRTAGGGSIDYGHRLRTLGGRAFNALVRALTGLPYADTQCGLKGFTAPAAKLLFGLTHVDGFAFDVELLRCATTLGLSIEEVPVTWTEVAGSSIRPLADPATMLRDLVLARTGARDGSLPGWTVPASSDPAALRGVLAAVGEGHQVVVAELGGRAVLLNPLGDPTATSRALEQLGASPTTVSASALRAARPLRLSSIR